MVVTGIFILKVTKEYPKTNSAENRVPVVQ